MKSPLITMSAITGTPSESEIRDYLNNLKTNGIEQVMLYPRSGCELDYLSDEWFETVAVYLKYAKALDLDVWLYDDFNWPSGQAAGKVTAIEKYRLKSIVVKGENLGRLQGQSTYSCSLFAEKAFPDLLSKEAVDYFIECTHEKYYERFGSYFGNVIKGFFTDEPAIGYCSTQDSIPYYDGMDADYNAAFGRDFWEDMKHAHEVFCENAMAIIGEQFNKCFVKNIADWCEKHGVLMTGHLLADNCPFHGTKNNGNLLKNLSAFSIPGIDEIETPMRKNAFVNETILSLFGSAEYASGENGCMAELFALGPCDMSFSVKRCMIYLAACFKIDRYYLAVSPLDLRGNRKIKDYFNCFTADQPDFEGTALLAEEARCAAAFAKKDYKADVFVKYPTDICAAHITEPFDTTPFIQLINRLTACHLQWKYTTDDENREDAPVITFNDKLEYCINDTVTDDADIICEMLEKRISVTDKEGKPADGLFVRLFRDDSFIVLNLYAESGTYTVNGITFDIDPFGVFVSTDHIDSTAALKRSAIIVDFSIDYRNDNMIRAMYLNEQTRSTIIAETELDIRFAVRKDAEAYLEKQKIEAGTTPYALSPGMKNLYDVSDTVTLPRGTVSLYSGQDIRYLPSVFLIGDFSARAESSEICSLSLSSRKRTYTPGNYFSDFGKIAFRADLEIPIGAKYLELAGTDLYTCVFADQVELGKKICAPYIFKLDKSLQGKTVSLEILQHSTIGPIMSDVSYFAKMTKDKQWEGTPCPQKTTFGFREINWLF